MEDRQESMLTQAVRTSNQFHTWMDSFPNMMWAYWPDIGTVSTQPTFSHEGYSGTDWRTSDPSDRWPWIFPSLNMGSVHFLSRWLFKKHILMALTGTFGTEKKKLEWAVAHNAILALWPCINRMLPSPLWVCSASALHAQNPHWSPLFYPSPSLVAHSLTSSPL